MVRKLSRIPCSRLLVVLLGFFLLQSLWGNSIFAQDVEDKMKLWFPISLGFKLTDKLSLSTSQSLAFKYKPFGMNFFSSGYGANYELSKSWDASASYALSWFPNGVEGHDMFHKFQTRLDYRHKVVGLRMKHSLRYEFYIPTLQKFQSRIRYGNKIYFDNNFLPFSMRPEITNEIYYYFGGVPVVTYDLEGNPVSFLSPDGLHRYRLTLGLRFKAAPGIWLTFNYRRQWEFNTGMNPKRELNVPQGPGTSPKLGFNNLSFFNLGLSHTFDLTKIVEKDKARRQARRDEKEAIRNGTIIEIKKKK